jgi:putative endonuclease
MQWSKSVSRSDLFLYFCFMYKLLYVYILKCSDGTYYTGVTNSLDKRLVEHNDGLNVNAYTFKRRPFELVWHEKFTDYDLAIRWEKRLKKWSKRKKEALINGEWSNLKDLSKKEF